MDTSTRLQVWRRRSRLDRALAEGADPVADPTLALRARQLTRPSTRRAVARTLRKLVAAAEEPNHPLTTRAPVQREAVLAAREELIDIAHVFSGPGDIPPQAAALAVLMIWDSASPLYSAHTDSSVLDCAYDILEAAGALPAFT